MWFCIYSRFYFFATQHGRKEQKKNTKEFCHRKSVCVHLSFIKRPFIHEYQKPQMPAKHFLLNDDMHLWAAFCAIHSF